MKSDKKPTLPRLKEADPRKYAELCEAAGCYGDAYKFYSESNSPKDVVHAADLAIKSHRRHTVEGLCKKAVLLAETKARIAKTSASSYGGRHSNMGGVETIARYRNAQSEEREVKEETSRILTLMI